MAKVYKRGAVYWGRFQHQGQEIRRSLSTADRSIANDRLQKLIHDVKSTQFGEYPPRAWVDVWRRFMVEHFPTIKKTSATRYAVSLKALSRVLDGKSINDLSRAILSDFEAMRRADGVTPSSIRRDLTCLSLIIQYCEEWEWLAEGSNIVPAYMRRARKRGLKEGKKRTRYLTESEEQDLIAACNPQMAIIVQLAIDTGLRDQEIMSLQWRQVDLPGGTIQTTTATKSGQIRHVPLHPRSAENLANLPRHPQWQFVFCRDDGSRFLRLNKAFEGARRRAGLEGIRFHDLRRTAGCRWLQRDLASIHEVSAWLGHSSIAVTEDRYAFLNAQLSAQKQAQAQRSQGIR